MVVVGAGAGGASVAYRLSKGGARVLLLERGDWFDPADSPARHADWERRPSPLRLPYGSSDPTIVPTRGAAIDKRHAAAGGHGDATSHWQYRNPFYYSRAFGVGGSTLHYEGEAHRFAPHAFTPGSLYGAGVDWPLDYTTLAPWYALAEQLLGVSGEPGNPFKAPRENYPLPAHPLSRRARWLRAGSERLGWSCLPNPLALPSRSIDGRSPCMHSGHCVRGCPFGAKSSVDRALLAPALRDGRLEIRPRMRAIRLETRGDRITRVICRQDGKTFAIPAPVTVLAGGAVETPRLLLASEDGAHPNGIGNTHDQLGRNFLETVFLSLPIEAEQPIESWKGPPLDVRIWDFNRPDPADGIHGFTLSASGATSRYQGPATVANRISGIGRAHRLAMRERFGRGLSLVAVTDHQPHPDNRLTLSSRLDEDGVPKVIVRSDYGERDLATLSAMEVRLRELADACGARVTAAPFSSYFQPSATHVGGTCRMGIDPGQSVTDNRGRVHGMENLYIADGSVLPGQGMGDSPSLTIQALGLRTADAILGRY